MYCVRFGSRSGDPQNQPQLRSPKPFNAAEACSEASPPILPPECVSRELESPAVLNWRLCSGAALAVDIAKVKRSN